MRPTRAGAPSRSLAPPTGGLAAPRGHFEAIVESSDDAIISKSREAIITSWNRGAAALYGYTEGEAVGRPISMLIPPHRANEERMILDRVLANERVDHYETERVRKDGVMVHVSLTVSPIRDELGEIVGASVIARNITDRRIAEQRAERLRTVVAALSESLAPERVVEVVLEHALPALGGDAATLALVTDAGDELAIVASAGHAPERLAAWRTMRLDLPMPLTEPVKTGEPVFTRTMDELRERYPGLAQTPVGYESLAVLPLHAEGRAIGALSLSYSQPHPFDAAEQAFLMAVAHEAAQALARGRLYDRERQARAEAEAAREQLAFLSRASALLAESLELDQTLQKVAELAVPTIADWCVVALATNGTVRDVAVAHTDPSKVDLARELQTRYPPDPDAPLGVPNVMRTGRPELYPEITDELLVLTARDEEHLRITRELDLTSGMLVPLNARGSTLGVLTLVSAESGRRFTEDDLRFAEDLARRAALAVDNSIRYAEEHEAAVTLQRSLLPARLPDVPGVELGARYLPADREVGGDWYDAMEPSGGRFALTIGDVAGRGTTAAAVMGQMRNALRAYVFDGCPPAEAVAKVNRLSQGLDRSDMATLFHASLDVRAGRLEYVRAGHPPGFVRHADGRIERLAGPGGPPVGVWGGARYEATAAELERGATVVLYTDGLIERRGAGIDVGLERLEQALRDGPDEIGPLCDWLIATLAADGGGEDDVAVLAFRLTDPGDAGLHLRLAAEPRSLARMRHALEAWLADAGASRQFVHDVVAACNEACANAVEHAYGPGPGAEFELAAAIDGDIVWIRVRDFGTWRPQRERGRGRGLGLMDQLVDNFEVERGEGGTQVTLTRRLAGERAA